MPINAGSVTVISSAPSNESINCIIVSNSGFQIKSISVVYADEYDDTIDVAFTRVNTGITFVMPSAEVFIRVEFEEIHKTFTITSTVVPENTASVNVPSISPAGLQVDGQIANVSEGYSVSNVYAFYLDSNANPIDIQVTRDGTIFAFFMPEANVNLRIVTTLVTNDTTRYPISAEIVPAGTGYFTLAGSTHVAGTSLTGDFIPVSGNSLISWQFTYKDTDNIVHQLTLTPIQIGPNRRFTFNMPRGDLSCFFITDGNGERDTNTQGGLSDTGGGIGTIDPETGLPLPLFDDLGYAVPVPSLPSRSASSAGFVLMYCPDDSDLAALSDWLWSDFFEFGENFLKLFSSPMDYIISLIMLPFAPDMASSKTQVKVGFLTPSNVSMKLITNQWKELNFGTIFVKEYWGSALDYSPYTIIHAFLPFIGSVQLDTDEVMGHKLGLRYRVDCMSGACVAMITVDDNVAYQFTGECGVSIPLTGADFSRVYGAVIGAVGTLATAGAVASGAGMMVAAGVSGAGETLGSAMESYVNNPTSDNMKSLTAAQQGMNNAMMKQDVARAAQKASAIHAIANTVGSVMGNKPNVQHSGNISGAAGMLGNLQPYIVIKYPNQSLADNYKHHVGYPANLGGILGSFTGFTRCESVILTNCDGTDGEIAEIYDLLKGGVYL